MFLKGEMIQKKPTKDCGFLWLILHYVFCKIRYIALFLLKHYLLALIHVADAQYFLQMLYQS